MSYNDSINYLYSLQKHGIKLGLDNTINLLAIFENPHNHFRSIHVAGTNGKGSTSAMIASILKAAGFKVGLFTSPHLVSFIERIRVNNEQISELEVAEITEEIKLKVESFKLKVKNKTDDIKHPIFSAFEPTFFEFVTAMAFIYFSRQNVQWAVVETGMGGRLDATNVLMPEVSVITNISYDHKEFLGDTISAIAGEKAGIIKDRIPVVSAIQEKDAGDVIEAKAKEKKSQLFIYGKDFDGVMKLSSHNGIVFDYIDYERPSSNPEFFDLFIPLPGEHQLINACLAIKAAMIACFSPESSIRRSASENFELIRDGLADVRWHGRLELIFDNPPMLIDGAHNPSAANILADSLKKIFLKRYKKMILILGIMADKEVEGIMSPLLPLASEIIFTAPAYERAAPPQRLAEIASAMGFSNVQIAKTVKDAIEMATKHSALSIQDSADENSGLIVITGSFYTIGEAKEVLGEKGILSRLRE